MKSKPRGRNVLIWLNLLIWSLSANAHIGSPNVFFEGNAGAYPVRVIVRPPGVIPGLAEISVRVNTSGVHRVTVLPMRWDTGRQGAPPPDEAKSVLGESNLYSGELWFMRGGAQSVEVEIFGAAGSGAVIVPVNAIATRVLGMPDNLGRILAALGIILVVLAVSIAGTAVRESVLPAGQPPTTRRRWLARAMIVFSTAGLIALLAGGKHWWDLEARDYRNNRLYRPIETKASLLIDERRILRVERSDPSRRNGPLVPDHGKLMHLFLVREPQLDAFAHLHPHKRDWKIFETGLPDLPAGEYRLYADITYESGLSDTLTTTISLPEPAGHPAKSSLLDADDSWRIEKSFETTEKNSPLTARLSPTHSMEWISVEPLVENRDTRLRFVVRDSSGDGVKTEPYMGMSGHLILRRDDGSVFTHLHPSGSFSMAAKQLFELRAEGKAPFAVTNVNSEPICRLPSVEESQKEWLRVHPADAEHVISFPYAFPKAGRYRLWVQAKVRGEVLTGAFDAEVMAAKK